MRRPFALCLAAFLMVATASMARAEGGWEFAISPYLWTPSLSGDLSPTASAPTASLDLDISDVLSKLNFGAMGTAEARKGRWSILGNAFYANISEKDDVTVRPGIIAPNRNVKVGARTFFAGLGVGYDVYSDDRAIITTAAGFRYWDVENELRISGGLVNVNTTVSETWVDPLVGLGGVYDLGDGFSLKGFADLGGFGVGSDVTWSLLGLVGYSFNDRTTAYAGWRHLEVDYDDNGFLFDAALSGPLVGVSFEF